MLKIVLFCQQLILSAVSGGATNDVFWRGEEHKRKKEASDGRIWKYFEINILSALKTLFCHLVFSEY